MSQHRVFIELIFCALKMTMLVSTVSPVTTLGIIQCRRQELIFLFHSSPSATGNRCSPKPIIPVLPMTNYIKW